MSKYYVKPVSNFGLLSYVNPVTGSALGAATGAIKGSLEQSPYEEITPTDRLGKVLTNSVLGAGAGASLGILPKLATMDEGLNKIASTVETQTGTRLLPNDPKVTRVKSKTATLENEARQLADQQKLLEQRAYNRELRRKIKQAERDQNRIRLQEDAYDFIGDRGQDILNATGNVVQGTINAGRKTREAVDNVRSRLPKKNNYDIYSPYNKKLNVTNFSNVMSSNLYGVDKRTLGTALTLGAIGGSAIGGLKGATDALTQNKIKEQTKLDALNNIQDPYFRYRQEEIYNSTPAKIGRGIDNTISGVGNAALIAGVGAGVGAGALGGSLLGIKYLRGKTF